MLVCLFCLGPLLVVRYMCQSWLKGDGKETRRSRTTHTNSKEMEGNDKSGVQRPNLQMQLLFLGIELHRCIVMFVWACLPGCCYIRLGILVGGALASAIKCLLPLGSSCPRDLPETTTAFVNLGVGPPPILLGIPCAISPAPLHVTICTLPLSMPPCPPIVLGMPCAISRAPWESPLPLRP